LVEPATRIEPLLQTFLDEFVAPGEKVFVG
jgi:hypothetical protein